MLQGVIRSYTVFMSDPKHHPFFLQGDQFQEPKHVILKFQPHCCKWPPTALLKALPYLNAMSAESKWKYVGDWWFADADHNGSILRFSSWFQIFLPESENPQGSTRGSCCLPLLVAHAPHLPWLKPGPISWDRVPKPLIDRKSTCMVTMPMHQYQVIFDRFR